MQSILLPIKPKQCESIINGKQEIIVVRTKPKLETPFKCYIYCVKDNNNILWYNKTYQYCDDRSHNLFDKPLTDSIIGEFICDKITNLFSLSKFWLDENIVKKTGLLQEDIIKQANGAEKIYGWYITNFVFYNNNPKSLNDFKKINRRNCYYSDLGLAKKDCTKCKYDSCSIQRVPSNWQYVEDNISSIDNQKMLDWLYSDIDDLIDFDYN